jgi:hypothetical protein
MSHSKESRAFKINKLECMHKEVTYQIDMLMTLFSNRLDIYQDSSIFTLKLHIAICHAGESCRDFGLLDEASYKAIRTFEWDSCKRIPWTT